MAIENSSVLDAAFRALGDGSRRRILAELSSREARSAGELVQLFDSSQPTISKHLRVMEKAGLVERRVVGRKHFFTLRTSTLNAAQTWIGRHLDLWENSLDRLGTYLDEEGAS